MLGAQKIFDIEHAATHDKVSIAQKADRKLLVVMYYQTRQILQARASLFGDVPDTYPPKALEAEHPTILKAKQFFEPIARLQRPQRCSTCVGSFAEVDRGFFCPAWHAAFARFLEVTLFLLIQVVCFFLDSICVYASRRFYARRCIPSSPALSALQRTPSCYQLHFSAWPSARHAYLPLCFC